MRYFILVFCLLITSCVSTKPLFYAAKVQENSLVVHMYVYYDDYTEQEVSEVFSAAVIDFALRTNIIVDIVEYRHVDWQAHHITPMSQQVIDMYPGGAVPGDWSFMIYKKTTAEWIVTFLFGTVDAAADIKDGGARWAFTNRLTRGFVEHEMYHLGWDIENGPLAAVK